MIPSTLPAPRIILFDWHGTLVDTYESMYRSVEAVLQQLDELDLVRCLVPEEQATTADDEKLLRYLRIFRHLRPQILAERRVSRTDIFDVLFGDNDAAKTVAHRAYNQAYRRYYGHVKPFQDGIYDYLCYLRASGIRLGVVTNRSRFFFDGELTAVDDARWVGLFDTSICGDEARRYKPAPDSIQQAAARMGAGVDGHLWYVGDSVTDMMTAANAGATAIFYNGGRSEPEWFEHMFPEGRRRRPAAVVDDFEQLLDLVDQNAGVGVERQPARPRRLPPRPPPPQRQEADWHPALVRLTPPTVVLFDWHATLVDTLDAMYRAVDDMLREIREMGLLDFLVPAQQSKSPEDEKLVAYVRENLRLHPKVKLDRKISRTDIFEVLFGDNENAKQIAHKAFTGHYRKYFGNAQPFEPNIGNVLRGLRTLGLTLGVITNRDREFFLHELAQVDGGTWSGLFQVEVCGDDTERRKPHPDQVFAAARQLNVEPGRHIWYVGDSTTDVMASRAAGITSVFFNGAQWDLAWLNKIFPGTERYPHKPDVVVSDFSEFWALVLACRRKQMA